MDYGLAGYWNMDEGSGTTLYDQSDNGNNGTLVNGVKWTGGDPVSASAGGDRVSSGSALQFDGVNDYVNAGNDPSLNITDAITIEAWVKTTEAYISPETHSSFVSKWNGEGYIFWVYDGDIKWGDADSNELSWTGGETFLEDGSWHHLVAVRSGAGGKIYFDGIEKASKSTGFTDSNGDYFNIGAYSNGSKGFFNGSIDEVRIYDRALSAEEVRYHYNRGGPVAHWRFDEGEGQTAFDETGNNNDGTLHLGSSGNTATSTAWVSGKHGTAMDFDGTDDYVDCGHNESLSITGDLTISFWAKPRNLSEGTMILGTKYNREYMLEQDYGTLQAWQYKDTSPGYELFVDKSNFFTEENIWYYITVVRDKTNKRGRIYKKWTTSF